MTAGSERHSEEVRWASYLYSEPDSQGREVLRNLPGYTDQRQLDRFERIQSAQAEADLPRVTADADGLRAMHHHLFKSVYPWAGQFRAVELQKTAGGYVSEFTSVGAIEPALATAFRRGKLVESIRDVPAWEAAEKLAGVVADINVVHPFREGNGRTMRAFLTAVAREAGWNLDASRIEARSWNQGSIESFAQRDNTDRLAAAIEKALVGRAARDDVRDIAEPPVNDRRVGRGLPPAAKEDPVKQFSEAVLAVRDAQENGEVDRDVLSQAVDHVLDLRRTAIDSVPQAARDRVTELSAALLRKTLGLSAEDIQHADAEAETASQRFCDAPLITGRSRARLRS